VYKSEQIVQSILNKTLTHTAKGAPEIDGAFISISDTKSYWVCAVSEDIPVGIDIEELDRSIKPAVAKKLHPDEMDDLSTFAPGGSEWREEFLSIWTRKEAYMKMEGLGLRMGLASFSVLENDDLNSFKYQKLMIGVAGDLKCDISWPKYEAPFEDSCLVAATIMLNTRSYSSAELTKKLKTRGYDDQTIQETIARLLEYGYLNDMEYAKSWARRMFASGKAPRRIEYELETKGIDKEIARQAAAEYKESSREAALKIAEKYKIETEKDLNRLGRKLASLGYEAGLIYDIINKLRKN
ncbi:MAG: RecX family transcriptional regulator, partial [Bacillota bacterium]|nr:RecX family transcriptional regulator [Bacillota bacterium]